MHNIIKYQPMTHGELTHVLYNICERNSDCDRELINNLNKRIASLLPVRRSSLETSTPYLKSLYHTNKEQFIVCLNTIAIENRESQSNVHEDELDAYNEQIEQRVMNESRIVNDNLKDSLYPVAKNWSDKLPEALPELKKTRDELQDENRKIKKQVLCKVCPERKPRKASVIYINIKDNGQTKEGHVIHCKYHALSKENICHECDQVIDEVNNLFFS